MAAQHDNHGQTPAAWTSVTIIFIGFVVGCIAVMVLNWVLLGVGAVIIVVGAVVGKVMQMMGLGKKPLETSRDADGDTGGDAGGDAGRDTPARTGTGGSPPVS